MFHASGLLPGGFLGVDIFFVISGFLVAQIAGSEIAATDHFKLIRCIERRFRRVIPPMALVALANIAIGLMIDTPGRMIERLPGTAVAALASAVSIYFLYNATDYFQSFLSSPLLHLWSLSVEVQFYVFFASVVALITWLRSRLHANWGTRAATGLVAAITALSLLAALTIGSWHSLAGDFVAGHVLLLHAADPKLWEFGFGILASIAGLPARRWSAARS